MIRLELKASSSMIWAADVIYTRKAVQYTFYKHRSAEAPGQLDYEVDGATCVFVRLSVGKERYRFIIQFPFDFSCKYKDFAFSTCYLKQFPTSNFSLRFLHVPSAFRRVEVIDRERTFCFQENPKELLDGLLLSEEICFSVSGTKIMILHPEAGLHAVEAEDTAIYFELMPVRKGNTAQRGCKIEEMMYTAVKAKHGYSVDLNGISEANCSTEVHNSLNVSNDTPKPRRSDYEVKLDEKEVENGDDAREVTDKLEENVEDDEEKADAAMPVTALPNSAEIIESKSTSQKSPEVPEKAEQRRKTLVTLAPLKASLLLDESAGKQESDHHGTEFELLIGVASNASTPCVLPSELDIEITPLFGPRAMHSKGYAGSFEGREPRFSFMTIKRGTQSLGQKPRRIRAEEVPSRDELTPRQITHRNSGNAQTEDDDVIKYTGYVNTAYGQTKLVSCADNKVQPVTKSFASSRRTGPSLKRYLKK